MTVTYVVVACTSDRRWFDLDAVRTDLKNPGCEGASRANGDKFRSLPGSGISDTATGRRAQFETNQSNPAGAPPLDWWDETDNDTSTLGETMTTSTITLHIGDVRDVMATLPDSSIDFGCTSPPFLALRSYLPADHPDKHREIGSEPTPASYLDTLLELTQTWRRLLTPTGSLCVELGDTYSGKNAEPGSPDNETGKYTGRQLRPVSHAGPGWPLPKSLCGIPTLYAWSLAYGHNLLNPDHRFDPWRIRNLLTWTRPNPPVGALGDKFRPATSFVTVACTSDRRWFDLDAVRTGQYAHPERIGKPINNGQGDTYNGRARDGNTGSTWSNQPDFTVTDKGGAPPLDWWDEDWQPLHRLPTHPYKGAHYATYPVTLPRRLIKSMCPRPGIVLDPFTGSGTTLIAAALTGRDAIGIDLDIRNVSLVEQRIQETLRIIDGGYIDGNTYQWTVTPATRLEVDAINAGQLSLFDIA